MNNRYNILMSFSFFLKNEYIADPFYYVPFSFFFPKETTVFVRPAQKSPPPGRLPPLSSASLGSKVYHVDSLTLYLSHLLLVSVSQGVITGFIFVPFTPGMGPGPELVSITCCSRNGWRKRISDTLVDFSNFPASHFFTNLVLERGNQFHPMEQRGSSSNRLTRNTSGS